MYQPHFIELSNKEITNDLIIKRNINLFYKRPLRHDELAEKKRNDNTKTNFANIAIALSILGQLEELQNDPRQKDLVVNHHSNGFLFINK